MSQTQAVTAPTVAVWRDHILGFSETFIADQALQLPTWSSILVGLERRHSPIALPEDRVVVTAPGVAGRILGEVVRRTRWLPPWWLKRITAARPALVHAHYAVDACHALPLVARLGVPLIVTCHGYDVAQDEARIAHPTPTFRRYLARRDELFAVARRYLAVSAYTRGRMIEKGFPAARIVVAPIGVDLEFFAGRPAGVESTGLNVLFVGRLSPEKGVFDLLRALALVGTRIPGVRLDVLGDGPERAVAERMAAELGLHAVFHGALARAAVREHLGRTQVFCVPSKTSATGGQETFGLVFAEAEAMGVPVVSYRSGGVPEAVADGQAGILVAEGDVTALAEALATLLADIALCRQFGAAGRAHVEAHYDRRQCIAALEQLYAAELDRAHA